jgi:ferritin
MSHKIYKLDGKVMSILEPLISIEIAQSSFYVQLANLCNEKGFLIAEDYFLNESKEEREHFLIHYSYVTGQGSYFQTPAIEEFVEEANNLYDIVELALSMEARVSEMYKSAASEMAMLDQMTYNHLLQFLKIQQDAMKFYIDACATLVDIQDKSGFLVAEKMIFKL